MIYQLLGPVPQLHLFAFARVLPGTGCRTIPLIPFLKLQARLEGLPVEQLDMHMARQLAEELGLSYQAVSAAKGWRCTCRLLLLLCPVAAVLLLHSASIKQQRLACRHDKHAGTQDSCLGLSARLCKS
jgi:hypothetical protein